MKIFKTYDDALVRAGANALISNDLGIDSALDLGTRLKEKKVVGINLSKTPQYQKDLVIEGAPDFVIAAP